jgi:enolase
MSRKIKSITAREIISTGAYPTVETKVTLDDGTIGVASAPFGSSAGIHEAFTLTDKDPKRYHGLGMLKAVNNVENVIAPELSEVSADDQAKIDDIMRRLDGTPNLSNLGGNAIISVSLAVARAASKSAGLELFQYMRPFLKNANNPVVMPQPMMVLIEGGKHADDSTDLQEYMIICRTPDQTAERVRAGIETYQTLKKVLKERGYSVNVGYEGAFAPTAVKTNREPLELITEAIERTGYKVGDDIALAMDPAASEVFHDNEYVLTRDNRRLSASEMIDFYSGLARDFALISLEDGLAEDDWDNWVPLLQKLGGQMQIIGDDLTATNSERLQRAIDMKAINTILIKPNQAGTLTEVFETVNLARANDIKVVVSHRGGGDTTDTFIADLAVAANAEMIKCGPSRSERTEKYNRLMEIEELLSRR